MYKVGEKIIYPMHGVVIIKKMEEKKILNEKKMYYILELNSSQMTFMIPVDMSEKVGLRKLASKKECDELIKFLEEKPDDIIEEDINKSNQNWKQKYNTYYEKFKSGSIKEIANIIKTLFQRNNIKELNNTEKKLFTDAFKFLIDEISVVKNEDSIEIEHIITCALENSRK